VVFLVLSFLLAFLPIAYMRSSPIRAVYPTHLTALDLSILITLVGKYKLWSSPLFCYVAWFDQGSQIVTNK
jgi:hypothetical protein